MESARSWKVASLSPVHQNSKLFILILNSHGSLGLWHYWLELSCEAAVQVSLIKQCRRMTRILSDYIKIQRMKNYTFQKSPNRFNVILHISRAQTLLHRCPNQWSQHKKFGYHCITIPIVALTFVSGSGRVGQQSNCINKPVILFSCVFRKKIMIVELEDLRKAIHVTQENTNQ